MTLPQNLLVGADLCKMRKIDGGAVVQIAYVMPHDPREVAEYAGELLVGYGRTEEDARQKLAALCRRLDLLNDRIYA